MQHRELRNAPGQERKVEDREVNAESHHLVAAKDHFVDERREPGFPNDRRVEEVLKGRARSFGAAANPWWVWVQAPIDCFIRFYAK